MYIYISIFFIVYIYREACLEGEAAHGRVWVARQTRHQHLHHPRVTLLRSGFEWRD